MEPRFHDPKKRRPGERRDPGPGFQRGLTCLLLVWLLPQIRRCAVCTTQKGTLGRYLDWRGALRPCPFPVTSSQPLGPPCPPAPYPLKPPALRWCWTELKDALVRRHRMHDPGPPLVFPVLKPSGRRRHLFRTSIPATFHCALVWPKLNLTAPLLRFPR